MRMVDPHIHMYARTTDDYEKMALSGIESVIDAAFWLGSARHYAGTFYDYFAHLLGYESERAAQYGNSHHCALSVPRAASLLLRLGFPREEVERLVFWNPLQFHAQSPNFRLPDGVAREQLGSQSSVPSAFA